MSKNRNRPRFPSRGAEHERKRLRLNTGRVQARHLRPSRGEKSAREPATKVTRTE